MGLKKRDYSAKIDLILKKHPDYYERFNGDGKFKGPSLYFHHKALRLKNSENREEYLEAIYAALVSWGMHRMGENGAKMDNFSVFYESALPIWDEIIEARTFDFAALQEQQWKVIQNIFENLKIMDGNTRIVGNSKVMAHLLPDLIAPIDRQYTIWFLHGNTNINTNYQWDLFRNITENFYYKLIANKKFREFCDQKVRNNHETGWDTSILKVIDNIIIGVPKPEKKKS